MPTSFFRYPFEAGQIVTLKKEHPCGGSTWKIVRVASDATLTCTTCGHNMILKRSALEKACKDVKPAVDA
ncbi:MAG TPA: DUF951 domain-containing protein [Bacillota bacterium]|nr:DUF951 domain-containing protein [Bacillota bacterium]HPE39041.1 DUF951 domain-containing protein [Bacillota bacterium]